MFNVLAPIGKAFRAFFKSDVKLRRGESGLELVLESKLPAGAADEPAKKKRKSKRDAAAEREAREFQSMVASLTDLLDQMPENRTVLRHLVFIEGALQKKGARALQKVPFEVLKHALTQFEGVVVNWSDDGLACLRSKMAVALIERERADEKDDAGAVSSVPEVSPSLAHPVDLEGDDAAEAEAALLAAYGAAQLPGLDSSAMPLDEPTLSVKPVVAGDEPGGVEVQGELNSPSAKALAKSAKAIALKQKVDLRLRELQDG